MLRKLAVKRLTASDLTFFKWQYNNRNAGNQKAINLNADVFIDALYPGLPETSSGAAGNIPLNLSVYGPGLEGEYTLQRKITKGPTYKNWRLNGEFIDDPEENPGRFNVLGPGDLVVFEFFGDTRPESARAVFVSAEVPEDVNLHQAFDGVVGARPSMVDLTPSELARVVAESGVRDHPIFDLINLDTVIDAATVGDEQDTAGLRSPPSSKRVSRDLLLRAKSNFDRVGELGEQFVNSYLTKLKADAVIEELEWSSRDNAASPYDFRMRVGGEWVLIDVKATESSFNNRIHVSLSELRQMGYGSEKYDLYRVFEMDDASAKLRIAENMKDWAKSVVDVLAGLPARVTAGSVTVPPPDLPFGSEIEVEMFKEPEDPSEQPLFE